jgi:hypothetical protein
MLKRIVVMLASLLSEVSAYFSRKSCHLMKTEALTWNLCRPHRCP